MVGAIAVLFPILILVGTATRLAAARREERHAALRLVGATSGQLSVISSVDAVISALLGAILGIGVFLTLQPWLAGTAITSQRYFASEVTPTAAGYLIVLIGVPAASAISSLLSLRRVRISPLGVARRATPPAPTAWALAPLLIGVVLFVAGLLMTSSRGIGQAAYPGLIVILIGLVVAGPWLTAQAARLLTRFVTGASALLAARRTGDNPHAAFRSVRGLVLAVFLGAVLAGLLPAVDAVTTTPSAKALSSVLLDGFTAAPALRQQRQLQRRPDRTGEPAGPAIIAAAPHRDGGAAAAGGGRVADRAQGDPRRLRNPHLLAAAVRQSRRHRAQRPRLGRARKRRPGGTWRSGCGHKLCGPARARGARAILARSRRGRGASGAALQRQSSQQHPADRQRVEPVRPGRLQPPGPAGASGQGERSACALTW